MADSTDYLLQAVSGALEGFEKGYVPFKKMEFEDTLARRRKKQELADELTQKKELATFEQPLKLEQSKVKIPQGYYLDVNNMLQPIPTGGKLQGMDKKETVKPKKVLLPKSEYLKRTQAGEVLSADEYQVVDDTKSVEETGKASSIVDNLNKLKGIREGMSGTARAMTLVPGGTAVGKLGSASLSEWDTTLGLVSQDLAKMVEKNRLSDSDRKFYLSKFSSPASSDEAFNAGMDALISKVSGNVENKATPKIAVSKKKGGVLHVDKNGNKAMVYPDGSFDEVK